MAPLTTTHPRTRAARLGTPVAAVVLAAALATVPSGAQAALGVPVPLGAASTFAVLGGSGVTNTGPTVLGGDIGSFPTPSITGSSSIVLVGGVDHGGDAVAQQAKTDLVAAYGSASSQTPATLGGVELGGLTLEPGVYDTGGIVQLNGNLTLDGNGDPAAVFVFQSLSTMITGSASSITFVDGASACNLSWRVPTSATIGAGSQIAGTIMAEASISFGAGATLQGRALAQTGAVTLISNTITLPVCAAAPTATPTPVPTASTGVPTPVPTASAGTSTAAPQVTVRPRGGVATGDGSSVAASADGPALLALGLLGTAAVALLVSRPGGRRPRA